LLERSNSTPLDDPQAFRHRCRNPNCRAKLSAPVSIERNAFCCRACVDAFYRVRCLVCEQVIDRKTQNQKVCGSRKCRAVLRRGIDSLICRSESNSLDISRPEIAIKPDRGWAAVAGPSLSASAFRCASIPDGSSARIEAKNKAALEAAKVEANGYFTEPDWQEVISPDGVRCFVTRLRRAP
jgi:hypothetical protein